MLPVCRCRGGKWALEVYAFWQTASYSSGPPPYVLLGLASIRMALGEHFRLLTDRHDLVRGLPDVERDWKFRNERDPQRAEVMAIVAKSDYLRMAVVAQEGGFWLDADSIVMGDFRDHPSVQVTNCGLLAWHSEAFFGATPGNVLLAKASEAMRGETMQRWGNPGGLKELVAASPELIGKISFSLLDAGHRPVYGYETREVMFDTALPAPAFLTNEELRVLKLYNTPFSGTDYAKMSVGQFLDQPILLSRIFRHVEPSIKVWLDVVRSVEADLAR